MNFRLNCVKFGVGFCIWILYVYLYSVLSFWPAIISYGIIIFLWFTIWDSIAAKIKRKQVTVRKPTEDLYDGKNQEWPNL